MAHASHEPLLAALGFAVRKRSCGHGEEEGENRKRWPQRDRHADDGQVSGLHARHGVGVASCKAWRMSDQAHRDDLSERLDSPSKPDPWPRRLWTAVQRTFNRVSLNGAAIATIVVAVVAAAYVVVDRMMQLHTDALVEKLEGQANAMSAKIDGQSAVIAGKFDAMSQKIDAVDRRLTGKIDAVKSDVEQLDDRLWDARNASAGSDDDYAALAAAPAEDDT